MFPSTHVYQNLCSPLLLFFGTHVPQYLYYTLLVFSLLIFHDKYVSLYSCFLLPSFSVPEFPQDLRIFSSISYPVPIFPSSHGTRYPCSLLHIFYGTQVPQYLSFPVPTLATVRVRAWGRDNGTCSAVEHGREVGEPITGSGASWGVVI